MINFEIKVTNKHYDYVFDKEDKFLSIIPHLYPKIKGDWSIELVQPKIAFIRDLLDANLVPEYVSLDIVVAKDVLENLQIERPKLVIETKTLWDTFKEYLASKNLYVEPKVASVIYHRVNHTETALFEAVDTLYTKCKEKGEITVKDVKANILETKRYYANQVFLAFTERDKQRWEMFNLFEQELGTRMAFYTLRKYVKKLLSEKALYMNNEKYTDRNVTAIDAYSIIYAHKLFQEATNPNQLFIIMSMIERRQT